MGPFLSLVSIPVACLSVVSMPDQIKVLNPPFVLCLFFTFSPPRQINKTRPEGIRSLDTTASFSEIGLISCYFMDIMTLIATQSETTWGSLSVQNEPISMAFAAISSIFKLSAQSIHCADHLDFKRNGIPILGCAICQSLIDPPKL
jgi:hypothetical protein